MKLNRSIKNRDHISFTLDWDWNGNHSATLFSPTNNDSDNKKRTSIWNRIGKNPISHFIPNSIVEKYEPQSVKTSK